MGRCSRRLKIAAALVVVATLVGCGGDSSAPLQSTAADRPPAGERDSAPRLPAGEAKPAPRSAGNRDDEPMNRTAGDRPSQARDQGRPGAGEGRDQVAEDLVRSLAGGNGKLPTSGPALERFLDEIADRRRRIVNPPPGQTVAETIRELREGLPTGVP